MLQHSNEICLLCDNGVFLNCKNAGVSMTFIVRTKDTVFEHHLLDVAIQEYHRLIRHPKKKARNIIPRNPKVY